MISCKHDNTISRTRGECCSATASSQLSWCLLRTCINRHANNKACPLTCCSSSAESWRSVSCSGWGSPPWQQLSLCLFSYPRFFVRLFHLPRVHLCLFSVQPGSTSEPHGALPLMTDWLSFNPANLSSLPLCWCCTVQRLTSRSDLTRIAVHTVPPPCSTCLTLFLHTPQCDYTDLMGFQKKQDRACVCMCTSMGWGLVGGG